MTIDQAELGRRLRVAREACGLTQAQAAEHLNVSRPTLVQMEAGNRMVSSLELDQLAYLYGSDIRDLLADSFEPQDAVQALFRADSQSDESQVAERLRACMRLGRELTELERLLELDQDLAPASHQLAAPRSRWDAIEQGNQIAHEERRRLGFGWAPAPDLVEVLEVEGVRTALVELPQNISGITLADRNVGLFVVANQQHPVLRRRFSFAHEYAHALVDRDRRGLISRMEDRDDLLEVRANAFAAAFLMPEDGIRHFVQGLGKGHPSRMRAYVADAFEEQESMHVEGRNAPGSQTLQLYDVVQLAHHFRVSRIAMIYRLRNLRMVSEQELEHLKQEESEDRGKDIARLLDLPDPDKQAERNWFRHRFMGRALEAYRRELISRRKIEELGDLVGLSADHVQRLLDDAGLGFDDEGDVVLPE